MTYSISDDMTERESAYVERKLVAFGDDFLEPRNYREVGIVLRDAEGGAHGGIIGHTVWEWLHIGTR